MTNGEFKQLYNAGNLENISEWVHKVTNTFGETLGYSEIVCCMYRGKYYIRISKLNGLSRLYHEELRSTFVKEFDNKDSANRYFKKVKSDGYERR
ncbi:MAG: hypothetical protein HFH87_04235 [Lachnospiraceae bacterium]|nr:hypothetical protein [Lachnospiraceae bacterium]